MQPLPVFTKQAMVSALSEISPRFKKVEVYGEAYAVAAFLTAQPATFLRGTMRVSESELIIILESEPDEAGDADDELTLRLPQG